MQKRKYFNGKERRHMILNYLRMANIFATKNVSDIENIEIINQEKK